MTGSLQMLWLQLAHVWVSQVDNANGWKHTPQAYNVNYTIRRPKHTTLRHRDTKQWKQIVPLTFFSRSLARQASRDGKSLPLEDIFTCKTTPISRNYIEKVKQELRSTKHKTAATHTARLSHTPLTHLTKLGDFHARVECYRRDYYLSSAAEGAVCISTC
jgi:hypothetical protein